MEGLDVFLLTIITRLILEFTFSTSVLLASISTGDVNLSIPKLVQTPCRCVS
jgi:hypothetical protein